jgi:hypothetical protein
MHRIDAGIAVGKSTELSSDHDGRIVADVVAEWSARHGQRFVLELDGVAGGAYACAAESDGADRISMDAVEFCRTLAGRLSATGLLTTVVPF